jgi:hypothetical protein
MPDVKIEVNAVTQAAENGLRRFQANAERIFAGIISAATVTAVVQFGKRLIDLADNLNKMSQRVGESVEWLSTFRFAAKLSNVELGELEFGLKNAARTLVNAAQGGREANEALDRLSISARNADGSTKRLSDLLFEVADRFKAMPDGVEKTDAALSLFGRSGESLIPLLNEGSDGLRKMQGEARRLGLEISGLTAQQAQDLNDNLTRLNETLTGFGLRVLHEVLPGLLRFSDAMARLAADAEGFRQSVEPAVIAIRALASAALGAYFGFVNLVRGLAILMAPGINAFIDLIQAIPKALDNLWEKIGESLYKIAQVFQTFGTLGTGLKQLWEKDFIGAAISFDKFSTELKAKMQAVFTKNEGESPFAPIAAAFKNTMDHVSHLSEEMFVGMFNDFTVFKRLLDALWSDSPLAPSPAKRTTKDGAGSGGAINQRDNTNAAAGQIGLLINQAEREAARISADATKDQVEKKRELLPLLAEQNDLLLMQTEIYLHLRAAARTDKERLEADQQLEAIRAKTAQIKQDLEELNSRGFIGEMQRGLAALSTEWGNLGGNIARTAIEGMESAVQGVTDSIMGAIEGTRTWGQVFAGVAKGIIANLIQVALQFVAKMVLIEGIRAVFQQKESTKRKAELPEKLTDAAATSVSSYGVAALVGAVALGAILALALSSAFAQGGLVDGPGTDTSDNLLARLSPGEFVVTAPAVRKYGAGFFERANAGVLDLYDAMSASAAGITRPMSLAGGSGGSPGGAAAAPQVHIVQVYNDQDLLRVLQSELGKQIVVTHIKNNKNELGIHS